MDDVTVYPGKNLADIFEEVHSVTKTKRNQIQGLIDGLTSLIKTSADAMNLVPMIQGYLDTSVKNDEQLLKMATIVQRMNNGPANGGGSGVMLSEEERKQLFEEVKDLKAIASSSEEKTVDQIRAESEKVTNG